jgi:signal peptidase I
MDNLPPIQDFPLQENSISADSDVPTEPVPHNWTEPVIAFLIELIQTLLLAAVLYFMIDFVVARVRVENVSMKPTLEPGEFLLVNKLAYKVGEMKRGDIVIFHFSPQEDYIKRLIGLPGDKVEIQDDKVTVNGRELDEPYIASPPHYNGSWEVPAGSIFVLGDNRNQSSDSHSWGFVTLDKLIGKALAIYWPIQNAHVLSHPDIVKAASANAP